MKRFLSYLEEIRKQKKLTKTGGYLTIFGILLFLAIALTLPNYFLQKQQTYKSQSAAQPASALAAGNTYYVATNGNDANPCTQASPCGSIKYGMSKLSEGDTLYLRGGTYNQDMTNQNTQLTFRSGTSWSSPITVAEYPGETVTIDGMLGFFDEGYQISYWIFNGFDLNRHDQSNNGVIYNGNSGVDHVRFSNMDITNNYATNANPIGDWSVLGGNATGNCVTGRGDHFEFINLTIHECGAYGIYFNGNDSLFDGIKVHDVYQIGLHLYITSGSGVNNNIVRNTEVWNVNTTLRNGGVTSGLGVIVSSGNGNQVYNSIFHDLRGDDATGIQVAYGGSGYKVYNNTVYLPNAANGLGIWLGYISAGGADFRNNILYAKDGMIDWTSVNPTYSNNLCQNAGTFCAYAGNPNLANPGARDFHLTAASTLAIDRGVTLSSITTDFEGTPRPQGSAWDIGADEFGGTGPTPTATPTPTPDPGGTGPVLLYTFDNTAADSSGNNYNGTLINSPAYVTGRINQAIRFNGTSQYVTNSTLPWASGGPTTVAFWVNTPGGSNGGAFGIGGQDDPNRFGAHVTWSDNTVYWDYGNTSGTGRISADFTPYLNQWTHVALVSGGNGGTFKGIYINGTLAASDTTSDGPDTSLTGIEVGRWNLAGSSIFYQTGAMDDFRVYKRMLTQSEIQTLANPTTTPTPANTPTPTPASGDTIRPTVTITSPANGSTVPRKTNITVTATATDNVGVTQVQFFRNGTRVCTDTTVPYSCAMFTDNGKNSTVTYTAQAFDAAGNSNSVSISVRTN